MQMQNEISQDSAASQELKAGSSAENPERREGGTSLGLGAARKLPLECPRPSTGANSLVHSVAVAASRAGVSLHQLEGVIAREFLLVLLEKHQWNITHAADAAGIHRNTLARLMHALGINRPESYTRNFQSSRREINPLRGVAGNSTTNSVRKGGREEAPEPLLDGQPKPSSSVNSETRLLQRLQRGMR